jgi:hypothetical protein
MSISLILLFSCIPHLLFTAIRLNSYCPVLIVDPAGAM